MKNRTIIGWITAAMARGIAWVLAVKLGMAAAAAEAEAQTIAEALCALVVAGAAIYSSVTGRRKLLAAEPPRD